MAGVFFLQGRQGPPKPNPFYFYHVPKSGGMFVENVVFMSWRRLLASEDDFQRACVRIDDPGTTLAQPPIFAISHLPFGAHERYSPRARLITFLREPRSRVVSAYTYFCMRQGRAGTAAEFETFFRRGENRNVATKILSGLQPEQAASREDLARALRNLDEYFAVAAPIGALNDFLRAYLSIHRLPNVVVRPLNRTTSSYRLDLSAYRDELGALNALDEELFAAVTARPRMLEMEGDAAPMSDLNVFIVEVERTAGNHFFAGYVDAAQMSEMGTIDATGAVDLNRLDALLSQLESNARGRDSA